MKRVITILLIIALISCILSITCCASGSVYYKAASNNMKIALTFDDGPHPKWTPEILDILEDFDIRATFFVIGKNLDLYPDIAKRITEEGHEIGNHSYSHIYLDRCKNSVLPKELDKVNTMIKERYNRDISVVRPPGGLYNDNLENYAKSIGMNIVLWSVDTRDWDHTDPKQIIENVLNNTSSGDIILMHDFITGSSPTPEVLRSVIPTLLNRGFEFVTVSELIKTAE